MRILINTISTKKHSGGAFQIASNFLLKTLEHTDVEWYYITSEDLNEKIGASFESIRGKKYFVFPTQPDFLHTYIKVKKEIAKLENQIAPDVVYSVSAPSYLKFSTPEVMRFTNGIVTHPNKYSRKILSIIQRIKISFYCKVQVILIKNIKYFITQTETTKTGLLRLTGVKADNVKVVSNVLPASFNSFDVLKNYDNDWIDIACIGNPVPHKNFDIIPDVILHLKNLGIYNVRFHTTIPNDHPLIRKIKKTLNYYGLSNNLINHGRISQLELGKVYNHCKFCFLPTLLEVFSASTVEAMYFELPTVATNFAFNSEIFEDSCLYYTPMNAKEAASQFFKLITDECLQKKLVKKMKSKLEKFGNYDAHFNEIKNFLVKVANVSQ